MKLRDGQVEGLFPSKKAVLLPDRLVNSMFIAPNML